MTKTPKAPPAGSHVWNEQVGVTVWPVYLVQAHINTADDLLAKKTPFWSLKNTLYNLWPWVQRYFWPLAFSYSISPLHTHAPFFWCIEMNGVNEEQKVAPRGNYGEVSMRALWRLIPAARTIGGTSCCWSRCDNSGRAAPAGRSTYVSSLTL